MDNILSMVEGPKPTEISTAEQINEEILKEFCSKATVWDFYEITKGEYVNKSDDEKKNLIINYYNYMNPGTLLNFSSINSLVSNSVFNCRIPIVVFLAVVKNDFWKNVTSVW